MMKRSPSPAATIVIALLGAIFAGTTVPAANTSTLLPQVSIEAQFVEYLPDGQPNCCAFPKVTVSVGRPTTMRHGKETKLPAGQSFGDATELPVDRFDTVFEGVLLEVTPKLLAGGVLLDGRATITDILDMVQTTPPNEGDAVSYALRSVVVPLSLLLIPGEDYVTIPTAKRDPKTEIRLRVTLLEPNPADIRGTITATCLKGDQYLLEIRILKDLPNGQTAIVSAPQITVVGGTEGKIRIGRRGKDGTGYEDTGLEVVARVKEIDGKKVAAAEVTQYGNGAVAWQMELQAPVVATEQAAEEAKQEP